MANLLKYCSVLSFIVGQLTAQENGYPVKNDLVGDFINYVNSSPSTYHSVASSQERLEKAGYKRLSEQANWKDQVKPNGKYYVIRGKSSLVAFSVGGNYKSGNGFSIIASHDDSPSLRLKPKYNKSNKQYLSAGFATYGDGAWYSWFDRDLGLAGRLVIEDKPNHYVSKLVNLNKPIFRIPTLAIHLDNTIDRDGFTINPETELVPIAGTFNAPGAINNTLFVHQLLAEEYKLNPNQIADQDLALYDLNPATVSLVTEDIITGHRLDSLTMTYAGLRSLIDSTNDDSLKGDSRVRVFVQFDHEKVGSSSYQGAKSTFLPSILKRITYTSPSDDGSLQEQALSDSLLVSAEQGHAYNPSGAGLYESENLVKLNEGPFIGFNLGTKYATNSATSSHLDSVAKAVNVTLQRRTHRNDVSERATFGSALSSLLGVSTVDFGTGQLSKNAIREAIGTKDLEQSVQVLTKFYQLPPIKLEDEEGFDEL
ncbi:peptidase M18, aminopeptidase I [Conidiobolus coronatus NRRL 28638]|uniref:aspartyl aminopeptidase n=1 Tax=Conidiobolus coronatus (strain ATCC 28846 / CBS 209.66 / NRRL 28638) TaxID=796925 RepID=A0A137PJ51_CONC2|nr:peptidase M18, aminopeptidase I [Conidiobolus coronatus NRRL 28638]|eukprot:KXN75024.1 peptidase M18, aminopeptidase I [Conidiobolus coronatus NRRL 28638]